MPGKTLSCQRFSAIQHPAIRQVYAAHNEIRPDRTKMTEAYCRRCKALLSSGVNWTPGLIKKNYHLCKECNVLNAQKYNNENKLARTEYYERYHKKRYQCEKVKASQADYVRERKYGIKPAEFRKMLEQQDNKCACCSSQFTENSGPKVDHCHKTGAVRGLLCNSCNAGIGFLGDNLDGVQKAINYLERSLPLSLNHITDEV